MRHSLPRTAPPSNQSILVAAHFRLPPPTTTALFPSLCTPNKCLPRHPHYFVTGDQLAEVPVKECREGGGYRKDGSSIHDTSLNPRTRQEESTFQSPTHRSCSLLKRISPLLSPPPSEREQTVQLTAQESAAHGGAKLDQRGIEERRAARDAATGRRSLSSPIPIVEENGVDWMNCDGFLDYGLLDLSEGKLRLPSSDPYCRRYVLALPYEGVHGWTDDGLKDLEGCGLMDRDWALNSLGAFLSYSTPEVSKLTRNKGDTRPLVGSGQSIAQTRHWGSALRLFPQGGSSVVERPAMIADGPRPPRYYELIGAQEVVRHRSALHCATPRDRPRGAGLEGLKQGKARDTFLTYLALEVFDLDAPWMKGGCALVEGVDMAMSRHATGLRITRTEIYYAQGTMQQTGQRAGFREGSH
ncbi:hypothetical protein DFP72DRAFT_858513 [Ephemerocybe angulata]|uniref:Uncharacterized protein n=1 Tax=Ephemerocybe angulata TaxID=980116 RepID=A0A8H6HCG4_9AGAR|nr:hypothetical protein DFP72DRAFT_858513 [Tulosesus angulatus]